MPQDRRRILFGATMLLAGSLALGTQAHAQDDRSYILTTATTGGTYYPVGVAIATLVKVKLQNSHKIDMSAISSAGSGENVKLLRENQAQFAILQGLFGQWAWNGTGKVEADGKQEHLRSITMLWQNVEQMVLAKSMAKTGHGRRSCRPRRPELLDRQEELRNRGLGADAAEQSRYRL